MIEIDLATLLKARNAYEVEFTSRGFDLSKLEDQFDDRVLSLTCHVFVANRGNQRFQIKLRNHGGHSAFAMTNGMDHEIDLLQLMVSRNDLMVEECGNLFSSWVMYGTLGEPTVALTSIFSGE
ncbi:MULTISPECIES: HPF/RaiA family ribosome-associated protein [Dyella]|uniref:HPF/RaiA family ribosome-associated protein n=2 Tax=Dyella TaxID=231454 RepID=A0A4R0YDX4_9GAMM|nr:MULTISPECIES: HPF/RaiA family ribosome-associated protein [Dyella]TBR36155.1 HPF/RaiA family ribosome-associated protein [Dyella terrae]TCI06204.1 HPF/RaiA family ribosome-associated protein [Dyella soli]